MRRSALALLLLALGPTACGGGSEDPDGNGGDDGGSGGTGTGAGGTSSGGTAASGGAGSGTGGTGGAAKRTFVYVGSGDWGDAEPGRVTVYELERATRSLSFVSEHPAGGLASYLVVRGDGSGLFAGDEKNGGFIGFAIDSATGSLSSPQIRAASNENQPVYLSLSPNGGHLLAANYGQGSVDVLAVSGHSVGDATDGSKATGNNAHCIVIDAMNRVLVANTGEDTISSFTFDPANGSLTATTPQTTDFTSPRHIAFGPHGWAYVVSEAADAIAAFSFTGGTLSLQWSRTRLPAGATGTGADLKITPNGHFLYATNRGTSNTIVGYDLRGDEPTYIEHESTRGETPRNFSIDPAGEFLIVGNQTSQSLAIFDIEADGQLTHLGTQDIDPSPFFVGIVQL